MSTLKCPEENPPYPNFITYQLMPIPFIVKVSEKKALPL